MSRKQNPKRLVVVLDDVDRLRPDEIRDMVRLVRVVGDFPNTVYIMACDRGYVEECLGDGDRDIRGTPCEAARRAIT